MDWIEIAALIGGGLVAGIINTLAGGGSSLTVPLLVFLGLPGTLANGTNRVGVLAQNITAAWRFRREGLETARHAAEVLVPVLLGSVLGAWQISAVADQTFNRIFAFVMLGLLVPTVRQIVQGFRRADDTERSSSQRSNAEGDSPAAWSPIVRLAVFFGIGVFGGSVQAGVGLLLLFALERSGFDLVRANSIKVIVIAALTAVALPVFAMRGQIDWPVALFLALGFSVGGAVGARLTVYGGEVLIRFVLVVAVVILAGRLLGVY